MADTDERRDGVSQQTDELASALLGRALDVLAVGEDLHVLLALGDAAGQVESLEFAEDGPEECLEGARKKAAESEDAVILEFGERGYRSYSAYSLVDVTGDEDTFGWSEPAPAGEVEPLL